MSNPNTETWPRFPVTGEDKISEVMQTSQLDDAQGLFYADFMYKTFHMSLKI